MDDLIVLLGVIFAVISAINKRKKKTIPPPGKVQKQPQEKTTQQAEVFLHQLQQNIQKEEPAKHIPAMPGEGEGTEHPVFQGSLNAESGEGEDFCDPALGHERLEPVDPESVYAGEIVSHEPVLDLSRRGLWQGIVMSEVLARPAQRRRKG